MNSGKAETEICNIFNIKTQKTLTHLLYFERLTPKGFGLFTFLMSDVLFIPFPSKLFRSRIPASFNGAEETLLFPLLPEGAMVDCFSSSPFFLKLGKVQNITLIKWKARLPA